MKIKWLTWTFLFLLVFTIIPLLAQQVEIKNSAQFEEIKAKAEKGDSEAQFRLGNYYGGYSDLKRNIDSEQAFKWFQKAADQGLAKAQNSLGMCYFFGVGIGKDRNEAVKWYRNASDQGLAQSQLVLGTCYEFGEGVAKDSVQAAKLYQLAADQGEVVAQYNLAACYLRGDGVPKNYVKAYMWFSLASAQGRPEAKQMLSALEPKMSPDQIAEAQRFASEFNPKIMSNPDTTTSHEGTINSSPTASGSGFFITEDGHLITNNHVVKGAKKFRLLTNRGIVSARVVKVDTENDLALLKADDLDPDAPLDSTALDNSNPMKCSPLPVASSQTMGLGDTVVTIGFPDPSLQGYAPKFARGEIASLSGAVDDKRYFQISVPVQPGNSGGALVNERGNVIGIVSAKLDEQVALAASGALPENVNYAIKSSVLLRFLESIPEVSGKLKSPNIADEKFSSVIKSAQDAAVLVLVY